MKQEETIQPKLGRDHISSKDGQSEVTRDSSLVGIEEEPVLWDALKMEVSTGHMILAYMERYLADSASLRKEWEQLESSDQLSNGTQHAARLSENRKRNRYPEEGLYLPFDHSRILLDERIAGHDYINASYLIDNDPQRPSYIVAQSPMSETVSDFWLLLWQHKVTAVVFISGQDDQNYRYWPENGVTAIYGHLHVNLVSEHIWSEQFLVRSFYLIHADTGLSTTITQFHFACWPRNSVPQSINALLQFRRKVNKCYRGGGSPLVVHCDTGSDRSGTFCLLDLALRRLAAGCKQIDLAACLEHLREQRPGLVSSFQLYEFALCIVAEEVHAMLHALGQQTSTITPGSNH